MKKVAIMQPYFFPYIGYFQLLHAVDAFVLYDDVNYIKQGWIARNRILCQGRDQRVTLQLKGAGSFTLIQDVEVGKNREKLLKTIDQAYRKAPFHRQIMPMVESWLLHEACSLSEYLHFQIKGVCDYMGIETDILMSSAIEKPCALHGVDKVLATCKALEAGMYINAIGGRQLYDRDVFMQHGIKLYFLQPKEVRYKQMGGGWIPWLSIIDVLMHNSAEQTFAMLDGYTLL